MKKIKMKSYFRNEMLRRIHQEDEIRKKYEIPQDYELYNIKIEKTGKTFEKDSDDMGPNRTYIYEEHEITVTYKKNI